MPEIATAWVTLAISGKGLQNQIRREFEQAEKSAKLNPKINTSGLGSQGAKAGKDFGDKFTSNAKTALATLSAVTIGAGLVDQFKKVLSVGMDWQNNLNTLQAVTGATADQMDAAGKAARALGNDISLPATSANDAASAMTELAKGGFTVQQSMDATKGSLQLAAAAQISAADAATIQSQALQAFGLSAGDAGKISDTLANAANASSAEITDVAAALAQAGTVANQFGLSAQDTAAAIGLLANNGIKGSDAGTLLKSSLLALTDQSNPAQGAIQELGLTVYDAQGKFVGLHTLFQQLGEASKNMTPEMYQAATATLFGSDAMRLAGVAAKDGSVGFDQMRVSIDRQGAAADVAAAKTKGLPGAWERVKNAVESLQLTAFDAIQGPVSRLLDGMSAGLGQVVPKATAAWNALKANPTVVGTFTDTVNAFKGLAAAAKSVWPALLQIGQSLAMASAAIGVSTWKLFVVGLQAAAGALNSIAPLLSTIAGLMKDNQGVVTAAAGAWLLFKTIPSLLGRVGTAMAPLTSRVQSATNVFRGFGEEMRVQQSLAALGNRSIGTMGAAWATASARVSGAIGSMKGAVSGMVSALGGPFGAALAAAGVAFAVISAKNEKSTQSMKAYQDAIKATGKVQVDLNEALAKSGGLQDDTVKGLGVDRIKALNDELETASQRTGSFLDGIRGEGKGLFSLDSLFNVGDKLGGTKTQNQAIEEQAAAAKSAQQALDDLKLSNQSLADVTYGSQSAFDALTQKLDASGQAGSDAADKLREARQAFQDGEAAAKNLTPGFTTISDAIKTIGDSASTAEEKTNAFKTALDTLAGVKPDLQAATDQFNQTQQQLDQVTPTAGPGGGPVTPVGRNADGTINTATEAGHQLYEALNQIKTATAGVAGAAGPGFDMGPVLARNAQQLQSLADKFNLTVPEVNAYAASLGYVPRNVSTLVDLQGADETTQQIGTVTALLTAVPPNTPITITPPNPAARDELTRIGLKLQDINVNGHPQVEVTAPNGQVLAQLQQILDKIEQVKRSAALNFDVNSFTNAGDAQRARRGANADGSIVPMAGGGFRQIAKPGMADIYAGRGAGTIFAEQETGGEAYIPLAASKRGRSKKILAEVARRFGMNMFADGGITVESLKAFASQLSGGSYVRGGPPGLDGTDCSGAQAAIANYLTGGSGRFGTASEGQALTARGFMQGDPPPGVAAYWVGWVNGGPGGGHTAGTIVDPNGGNVNVEMGGANGGGAFGAGAQGASGFPNRAWIQIAGGEDPNAPSSFSGGSSAAVQSATAGVTSAKASVTSAQASLDQANAAVAEAKSTGKSADKVAIAEKKRDAAQQKLDAATQRQTAAETKLADAKDKASSGSGKDGGLDGQSFGQSLFSGILQGIGLDGSVFSNPLEWPNVKSGLALANFGGSLLQGASGQDASGGGLSIGGLNLPSIPIGPNADVAGSKWGAPNAPMIVNNGTIGMDPRALADKASAVQNTGWRKSGMNAVRPK